MFNILDDITGRYFDGIAVLDVPGVGIVLAVIAITLVGYLMKLWVTKSAFHWLDNLIDRIPGIRTLYNVIKDTLSSFIGEKKSFSKVAVVTLPGIDAKLLGFVTSEDCTSIGFPNYASVYVMQSMQIAGNTLLIPKDQLEIIDTPTEEIMKFIMSAGAVSK